MNVNPVCKLNNIIVFEFELQRLNWNTNFTHTMSCRTGRYIYKFMYCGTQQQTTVAVHDHFEVLNLNFSNLGTGSPSKGNGFGLLAVVALANACRFS